MDGSNSPERILKALEFNVIYDNKVVLWGTGKPLCEFLRSVDMADASVHVLLNVDFKESSVSRSTALYSMVPR